jgi:hypothetical protein
MARQALTGGAYQAHSVIAAAQRSVNLFAEPIPENLGEPAKATDYPTPGLRLLGTLGTGPIRAVRQATNGAFYVVSGHEVYSVNTTTWAGTLLGSITVGLHTPVSMADNTLDMLIVDGTANGWVVNLAANTLAQVVDSNGMFTGADRVDYLDTFFVLNKPGTPQFYISGSLEVTFDPLDFANKSSYADLLKTIIVCKREVWLIGEVTTEVWYNAGATDIAAGSFPFAEVQSVFVDHGIAAKYSVANYDNGVFWLTRDRQGQGFVVMGAGYQTKRISTYAIEAEIAGYARIDDAIGFCYQLSGHTFYVLTFPHADRTWVHDITTGLWHEWAWIDVNGEEHRHRANCCWPVDGKTLVVGDWQNGNLYALDQRVFTDNGQPIKRVRSFPHILNDGKRVFYRQFLADFDAGNAPSPPVLAIPVVPYEISLVHLDETTYTLHGPNTLLGFPATFNYLLFSCWICLGREDRAQAYNWANSSIMFDIVVNRTGIDVILTAGLVPGVWFNGSYAHDFIGPINNVQISVNALTGIVQVYVNDAALTLTSGGATGAPTPFSISTAWCNWLLFGTGGVGIADLFMAAPASFFDLSVTANRRKFQNADLSPVDIGFDGARPLGVKPAVYLTARDGAANNLGTNNGTGGALTITPSSLPLTFLAPGYCTTPWPPPAPPPIPPVDSNLISLEFSDDRGHSYGNPVSQSIGDIGEYRTSLQWQRLGMCRDRVFRLSWSVPAFAALQGCWVDVTPAQS